MTRAQLKTLKTSTFKSGASNTTASDVRTYEDSLIDSCLNVTDDADVNGGYLSINNGRVNVAKINASTPSGKVLSDSGAWTYAEDVATDAGSLALNGSTEKNFVFNGTTDTWISWAVAGNRAYTITNIGSGNLTVNYFDGSAKIIDLASSVVPVNTIIIPSSRAKTIIDNGTFLIFK